MPDHPRIIEFGYVNWRGQFAIRTVTPIRIYWGATKHHPQPQWLLEGFDHDKNATRDFALPDCDFAARRDGEEIAF
jgi:predicted DNA-binding transcriptional regulator YafY